MSQARQSTNSVADRERLSSLVNNAPISDVPAETRISRPVSRASASQAPRSPSRASASQAPRSPSRASASQAPRSPSRASASQAPRSPSRASQSIRELEIAIENDKIALENDKIALENDKIVLENDKIVLEEDKSALRRSRASQFKKIESNYIADKYATAAAAEELAQDAVASGNEAVAVRASAIAAAAIAEAKAAENGEISPAAAVRASRASRASGSRSPRGASGSRSPRGASAPLSPRGASLVRGASGSLSPRGASAAFPTQAEILFPRGASAPLSPRSASRGASAARRPRGASAAFPTQAEILSPRSGSGSARAPLSRFSKGIRSQFPDKQDFEIEREIAALANEDFRRREMTEDRGRVFAEDIPRSPLSPRQDGRSPRSLSAAIGPVPDRNMFAGPAYSAERGVVRAPSRQSRQVGGRVEFSPTVIRASAPVSPRQSAVIRSVRERDALPQVPGIGSDVNQILNTPSYFEESIPAPSCRFAPSRRSNMQ